MGFLRFFPALWLTKITTWYLGVTDSRKNDLPGCWGMKIDPQFLAHIRKPKTTVLVTGTNGKTTTTSILSSILEENGLKTTSNNWGPNMPSAEAWALADAVNFLNMSTKDIAVMEVDELTAKEHMPSVKPDYLIITNLGRDSMLRNANPEIIQSSISKALQQLPNTTLILNGDDPLSCFLSTEKKNVYFGVADIGNTEHYVANDFSVCPKCGSEPIYKYRNYRHIGEFFCPECGLKSPEKDYLCTEIGDDYIIVKEKNGEFRYSSFSSMIYNVYNEMAMIAFLREYGFSVEMINDSLKKAKLPDFRETRAMVNGIEVIERIMKGQNPSATTPVMEGVKNDNCKKEIVMMVDEPDDPYTIETVSWIWDCDYQLFNSEDIKKIIVCGPRHLDHKVRFLCAGVDPEKLVTVAFPEEIIAHVETSGIEKIYLLCDLFKKNTHRNVMNQIIAKLKGEVK